MTTLERRFRCMFGVNWSLVVSCPLTDTSVPHVTDAIQDWIERVAKIPTDDSGEEPDVCIIELGYVFSSILRDLAGCCASEISERSMPTARRFQLQC